MTYSDPYHPRVVRVKSVIWAVVLLVLGTLAYIYPYSWAKQRLDAAEQIWIYLNVPVKIDLGDGKMSPDVIRAVFINQALEQAVKQSVQAAPQTAQPPAGATK